MYIKYSVIIKSAVMFVLLMSTYILAAYGVNYPFLYMIARIIPLVLFVFCLLDKKIRKRIRPYTRFVNKYVFAWLAFFTIEIVYSIIQYRDDITVRGIVVNYWNVIYIVLIYPILYIMIMIKDNFFKSIKGLILFDTMQRAVCSAVYTISGKSLFLFFKEKLSRPRIGLARLSATEFHEFVFDLLLCGTMGSEVGKRGKRSRINIFLCVFLFVYIVFIDQSRSRLMSTIAVIMVWVSYMLEKHFENHKRVKIIYWAALILVIILFVAFGGIEVIGSSFSITGAEGGSTSNRLYALDYYIRNMQNKQLLGFGLLYDDTVYGGSALYNIMRNPNVQYGRIAFFEDFGILGQYFNYGILGIMLFGSMFVRMWNIVIRKRGSKNSRSLNIMALHVTFNTLLPLSIFRNSAMILVPLYLATFEYYNISE